MVDGIPAELAPLWRACLERVRQKVSAASRYRRSDQIVQALRESTRAEALRHPPGGSHGVSEARLLLAALCELEGELGAVIDGETPRSTQDGGVAMELARQLAGELADPMRVLSQAGARCIGSFPLAHKFPKRVGLLRGYGNAIVPQVAAEFIRAYSDL
jgi:hypothetical protein